LKIFTVVRQLPTEALIWTLALLGLAWFQPLNDAHFTICPLALAGFDFCPGCGLGRSISYLFHGQFSQSIQTHPLGLVAVFILVHRIITLTLTHIKHYGQST
jgi:hypothetical protein